MYRDGIVRVSVLLRSAAVVVGNSHEHHGRVSSRVDLLVIMVDVGKEVCARSVLNCLICLANFALLAPSNMYKLR